MCRASWPCLWVGDGVVAGVAFALITVVWTVLLLKLVAILERCGSHCGGGRAKSIPISASGVVCGQLVHFTLFS